MAAVRRQAPRRTIVVVSTTLDPAAHPSITVFIDKIAGRVKGLKEAAGKDIWLFGPGGLHLSGEIGSISSS
jgi:dihydrofolate reductase